jgi:hypothetical protein
LDAFGMGKRCNHKPGENVISSAYARRATFFTKRAHLGGLKALDELDDLFRDGHGELPSSGIAGQKKKTTDSELRRRLDSSGKYQPQGSRKNGC